MPITPEVSASVKEAQIKGRRARLRDRALELAVQSNPDESPADVVKRAQEFFDWLLSEHDGDE